MPFSPQQSVDAVKKFIKYLPFDTDPPKLRTVNDAQGLIWSFAPWRWTVGVTAATDIVNDSATVAVAAMSDFDRIVAAYLQLATGDMVELIPVAVLPTQTELKGPPRKIAATSDTSIILQPPPTGYLPAPKLVVTFKKKPTEITAANVATAGITGIPDAWFYVFTAAVLYYAYLYADDPRAGGAVAVAGGAIQYSGQLGVVMAALAEMRERELLPVDLLGQDKRDA